MDRAHDQLLAELREVRLLAQDALREAEANVEARAELVRRVKRLERDYRRHRHVLGVDH